MNVTRLEPYDTGHTERSEKDSRPRYMSGTTDAGETSDALIGLTGADPITVVVSAGTVEWTISPVSAIQGDAAVWLSWPHGEVATTTSDTADPGITGLRITAPAGGACTWEVRG